LNPFDVVKETLKIADITRFYGVEVKRNNQALCPFHNEKTPSFTIFPKTNSFKCFGCGIGGTAIDFVMAYFGLNALEAAKKLDTDFGLGLFGQKATQKERHKQKEREANKELAEAFESYIYKAFGLLCDYLHMLHDWKVAYAPKLTDELDTPHHLFVEACHQLDYIEHLTDFLLNAGIDEQIDFYQTHREELLNIAARIKQYTDSGNTDKSA
jgi:hypothetical protein